MALPPQPISLFCLTNRGGTGCRKRRNTGELEIFNVCEVVGNGSPTHFPTKYLKGSSKERVLIDGNDDENDSYAERVDRIMLIEAYTLLIFGSTDRKHGESIIQTCFMPPWHHLRYSLMCARRSTHRSRYLF
ncbi:hypothetical protein L1887_16576 [Cichorium endivia]|nr:hypothetical protein L1887_16576 [Cichorium endivia]